MDLNDIVAAYLEAVAVDDRQMVVYRAACSASMRRRKDGLHCVNYQARQAASAVAEEHPA
ncbi:MAG: hypothetical protein J2P48_19845 [Alphaproteobacteria bacterium]|nr:hypothetical protein [Alphaproteobacteria bacterium]